MENLNNAQNQGFTQERLEHLAEGWRNRYRLLEIRHNLLRSHWLRGEQWMEYYREIYDLIDDMREERRVLTELGVTNLQASLLDPVEIHTHTASYSSMGSTTIPWTETENVNPVVSQGSEQRGAMERVTQQEPNSSAPQGNRNPVLSQLTTLQPNSSAEQGSRNPMSIGYVLDPMRISSLMNPSRSTEQQNRNPEPSQSSQQRNNTGSLVDDYGTRDPAEPTPLSDLGGWGGDD